MTLVHFHTEQNPRIFGGGIIFHQQLMWRVNKKNAILPVRCTLEPFK